MGRAARGKQGRKKETKNPFLRTSPGHPRPLSFRARCSISVSVRYDGRSTASYVCHSSATLGQCPSFRYLPSNCSSSLRSPIARYPRKRISRDDVWTYCKVQQGSETGGWIREGGLFFSGERKNLICRWLSLKVRS